MITPQICQDYFAILFGHEGVAENAHLFAVMFAGRLERSFKLFSTELWKRADIANLAPQALPYNYILFKCA
jgi:hypothetical protein